jgi:hypothetical protein
LFKYFKDVADVDGEEKKNWENLSEQRKFSDIRNVAHACNMVKRNAESCCDYNAPFSSEWKSMRKSNVTHGDSALEGRGAKFQGQMAWELCVLNFLRYGKCF